MLQRLHSNVSWLEWKTKLLLRKSCPTPNRQSCLTQRMQSFGFTCTFVLRSPLSKTKLCVLKLSLKRTNLTQRCHSFKNIFWNTTWAPQKRTVELSIWSCAQLNNSKLSKFRTNSRLWHSQLSLPSWHSSMQRPTSAARILPNAGLTKSHSCLKPSLLSVWLSKETIWSRCFKVCTCSCSIKKATTCRRSNSWSTFVTNRKQMVCWNFFWLRAILESKFTARKTFFKRSPRHHKTHQSASIRVSFKRLN